MSRVSKTNKPGDLHKALSYLTRYHDRSITLDQLSSATAVPKTRLNRIFKTHCQSTPIQWIWQFRVMLAKEVIKHRPSLELNHVADICGFTSLAHFSRRFHSLTGVRPASYRSELRRKASEQGLRAAAVKEPLPKRQLNKLKVAALAGLPTRNH